MRNAKVIGGLVAKVLVIGAVGQIGTELTVALRRKYGGPNVVATTRKSGFPPEIANGGPCEYFDVTDKAATAKVIDKYGIDTIYLLAGLLSSAGEKNPNLAFDINLLGLKSTLDLAVEKKIKRFFWPSSIAAFGPTTPTENTPQHTILEPTTMYGMTKVAGELLCQYYFSKYGLDVRSVRYPGTITYKTEPSDGTTEYSIAMFYEGIKHGKYKCFLSENTLLPMMYIDDAINGTIALMEAPPEKLTVRTSYNFAANSFSPLQLASELKKHLPNLEVAYEPDFHQKIADSWPKSIDDSQARADWGWKHAYTLEKMTAEIMAHLPKMLGKN